MRAGGRAWARYVIEARALGSAAAVHPQAVLERELGLLSYQALADALQLLDDWHARGYGVVTLRDQDYPQNLRVVENRPPLLFISGALTDADAHSVAVIGTRSPSDAGRALAAAVAARLVSAGYSVFSGLAAGVDTSAHEAALAAGGRTVAVVGTGLDRCYPEENADLQRRIAGHGAVVSQFWPESPPTRHSFPARNAVMAGMTLATVVVEASERSGTRIQARHVLAQGRQLVLMSSVLSHAWATELAARPGVSVARTPDDVLAALRA